jgi:PTS system fructose-specific IIC component
MAAEGLRRAAETLGHEIKVETQGSVGAQDVLTGDEIAAADARRDRGGHQGRPVPASGGKRLYETSTNEALKNGDNRAGPGPGRAGPGGIGSGGGAGAVPAGGDGDGSGWRAALGGRPTST